MVRVPTKPAAAKDLAAADNSGQNALTDVTRAFSGYT